MCETFYRYTVSSAIREKNEHVFDAVKMLNALGYEKNRMLRKKKQLALEMKELQLGSRSNFEFNDGQRVRTLMTAIDKMSLKSSSARFIQKTYIQVRNEDTNSSHDDLSFVP